MNAPNFHVVPGLFEVNLINLVKDVSGYGRECPNIPIGERPSLVSGRLFLFLVYACVEQKSSIDTERAAKQATVSSVYSVNSNISHVLTLMFLDT